MADEKKQKKKSQSKSKEKSKKSTKKSKKATKGLKRPQTAYFLFCSKARADLKKKGEDRKLTAKELGVDKEEIVVSLDAIQDPISLQEPIYNEGSESIYIMDQIKDSKNTDELWAENITIEEAMKKLNNREKVIISKRYFDGRTQMEVAEEIGISQAQVSRLEKSAIDRIKKLYK